MPSYDYRCESCRKEFSVIQSITEHEKAKIKCPKCNNDRVRQQITSIMVKTGKKS